MEPQPGAPTAPTSNYDFIINPEKPNKRGLLGGLGKDPFIAKIVFLVGGSIVLMIVVALGINLIFGNKSNLETVVGLAQTDQEIVRLAAQGDKADSQQIKNAALNTQLTIKSHQQEWLVFLAKRNRTPKTEELNLKQDAAIDKKLTSAKQISTFDETYRTTMRAQLTAYASSIKTTYTGASNKQERALLNNHYKDVKLLLEQWPE